MSDINVGLRLHLVNQLSKPAAEAERDLKDLRKAADHLGVSKGGRALGQDVDKLGKSATEAKGKISAVGKEADELRRSLGRVDNGAFKGLDTKAREARQSIAGIGTEVNELKTRLNAVDNGAFSGLKADARQAEAAIRQVGRAADQARNNIRNMGGHSGGPVRPGVPGRTGSRFLETAEGLADGLGAPVMLGAGLAYAAGAVPAGALVAGGAAVNAAAGDEQRSAYLRITGQYDKADQARYDKILASIGAKRGLGTSGAQSVFGALQAGGLSSDDAAAMTDNAIVFSKATDADPDDAANLTVALRNNMKVSADQMMQAYNAMALGGKEGQFEVKDMARYFPELAGKMQVIGESGNSGVSLLAALMQAARVTTGTSSEAATNVSGMLGKFLAKDFGTNAEKYGLDPEAIIKKARSNGEQPVLAMLDAIRGKVGTDGFSLKQLMPEDEAGAGLIAAITNLDEIRARMGRMGSAKGIIEQDYETANDTFNSQKDRLSANFGKNIKGAAAPLLPSLTKMMSYLSTSMEKAATKAAERKDKAAIFGDKMHAYYNGDPNDAEGNKRRYEEMLHAVPRDRSGSGIDWKRFLFGNMADGGSFKAQMGIDLRPAASEAMDSYNQGLSEGGEKAKAEAQSIADWIKQALGFTVSPTISPTFIQPGGAAPAPTAAPIGKQSSLSPSGTVKVAQTFYGAQNPRLAAMRAQREQNRSIRMATARSLSDTGAKIA